MANNPYVSKIIFGDQTLIDLTSDTVAATSMLQGVIAHDASGASVTGTIATKTSSNVSLNNTTVSIPAGYYASAVSYNIPGVTVPVPSSGTNSFYVTLPNGANDTITLVFTVDASGNSDITEDATNAYGVSY